MSIKHQNISWIIKIILSFLVLFFDGSVVFSASKGGVLEIEVLKLYHVSKAHTNMDVRFINTSPDDIKHWGVIIEIYNKNDSYLGHSVGSASYIRSGESKIVQFIFLDTQTTEIAYWVATLNSVIGHSEQREDPKYILKVKTK